MKNQIQSNYFSSNSPSINNQQSSGSYELDNQSILSDLNIAYLSQMKLTPKDKDDFISLCQTELEKHPEISAVLQQLQESYTPDRALSCFRTDPMLRKIIGDIFQQTDTEKMYRCRSYIQDIHKEFDKHKCTTSTQIYFGQSMSNENLQQLKKSSGKIIVFKSFLSATLSRDIAMTFASSQNEKKGVLFEMEANPLIPGVKLFIKNSSNSKDQSEVLFMFGSLFKINEIRDGENGITIIKMALCADENESPLKSQLNNTNEEKDLIGFVQLQWTINQFLGYSGTLNNLDKLLENYLKEIPADHADRIRGYNTLGNVTSAKGDFDSSLTWYQKSLEIIQKPPAADGVKLAECYSNIAVVYLNKKDNKEALAAWEQALPIWEQVFAKEQINLVYYYTQLISIYESEGNFIAALLYHMQIYSIMLKIYPVDDGNLAPVYNNIGKTFVSLGQYPLALGYYQTSLNIKQKTHLPSSEPIALAHKNVGFAYKYMENMDQARTHFENAAKIYREVYSPTHGTVVEIETLIKNLSSSST